jgi:hypothetical protein
MRHPALGCTVKWLRGTVFFKRWSVWGTGVFHGASMQAGAVVNRPEAPPILYANFSLQGGYSIVNSIRIYPS